MMRVVDLFSGIGGFSLGLERTGGFETVQFCEIDPFAQKVLAKNWPGVPIHDDVTTLEPVGAVDLVTAGFPCQDISLAGQGAGLAGSRSGLFWHILRTARLVGRPRLLLENVAALLGRGMGEVLGALASVGYDAEWHCIPASAVGAPHRRDRIWIVAHANECEGGERSEPAQERGRQDEAEQAGLGRRGTNTHADGKWKLQPKGRFAYFGRRIGDLGQEMAHADGDDEQGKFSRSVDAERWQGSVQGSAGPLLAGIGGEWRTEPDVGRVAHGVPARAHRLAALGNAVVPQIPELIGHAILQAEGRG